MTGGAVGCAGARLAVPYALPPSVAVPMPFRSLFLTALVACALGGCDGGLAPPVRTGPGVIVGTVTYVGRWPSADSIVDLRFVAMPFVPRDTTDFLRLNELALTPAKLRTNVAADTFVVPDATPATYVYAGIAQRFAPSLFAWRPVGVVGAPFTVRAGETTRVALRVDFASLPPFPPR